MAVRLITTADGSHSLLNEEMDETYHSRHGALQESVHVFIRNGLEHWWNTHQQPASIFEVGFGTGLNAMLAAIFARERNSPVSYTSIEAFPIQPEIVESLNYAGMVGQADADGLFSELHRAPWNESVKINPTFEIRKLHATLEMLEVPMAQFDLVFFDAFAPSKQPDLWTLAILQKVCAGLKSGGVFVTYCAKGQLKRDLKTIGLAVETLPGPPGKKEMVRGTKP